MYRNDAPRCVFMQGLTSRVRVNIPFSCLNPTQQPKVFLICDKRKIRNYNEVYLHPGKQYLPKKKAIVRQVVNHTVILIRFKRGKNYRLFFPIRVKPGSSFRVVYNYYDYKSQLRDEDEEEGLSRRVVFHIRRNKMNRESKKSRDRRLLLFPTKVTSARFFNMYSDLAIQLCEPFFFLI